MSTNENGPWEFNSKKKLLKVLSIENEVAMCVNLNGMVLS
jgi:hypothetical protein